MNLRVFKRAFSSGELSPEIFGRIDNVKEQEGLAACRNHIALPYGPAVSRPGFQFVKEVKDSSQVTRVIRFSYNNTQTFAVELGAGYFRFHTLGQTLDYAAPAAYDAATAYVVGDMCAESGTNYYCIGPTTGNAPPNAAYWYALPADMTYEIPNAYAAADLMDIHYVQSADVLTLTHPNYPVMELRRYGATNWQFTAPSFVPPTNTVTGVTATATGSGSTTYSYVVTKLPAGSTEETQQSGAATCTNDLTTAGNYNTVTWTDTGASADDRYNVYKLANGIYGFIGTAAGTSFVDDYITADVATTPPIYDATVFTGAGNYPAAVSYYQQRRLFAGTANLPQNVWMTRSGTESDMGYTIPSLSDNRIAFRIAARDASAIRHIVPVRSLLLLTATCEWDVQAVGGGALTPTTVSVLPQSYVGSNNVAPVVINNIVLFAAARGGHIREMSYNWQYNGYITADISLFASHLFDYNQILDMAYCAGPTPILWCVSDSGQLLGLTYVPEQQVAAWHRHDTGAADVFESVCSVTEGNEDVLYAVIRRTMNGVEYRYVECLHSRFYTSLSDAFYVDSGATLNANPPTGTVTGANWLEGMTVNILADGAVVEPQVVTNGSFTLPNGVTASTITFGLPITGQLQTVPADAYIDTAFAQGLPKSVTKAWLRVYHTAGAALWVGPDFSNLSQYPARTTEPYGSPPSLVSDEIEVVLNTGWGQSGQICIENTDPIPLDLVAATLEMAVGGG